MLTQEEREAIFADEGSYTDIAERHNVHRTTVGRIRSGGYSKLKSGPGAGGNMACPGCGRTDYVYRGLNWQVVCRCGWIGGYDDMLFVKAISAGGRERARRI